MKNENLGDFVEYELIPAMYERLNLIFPEMHFERRGNKWESKHHLDGTKDGSGKVTTYVYENRKYNVKDQAQGNKGIIKLFQELRGVDYPAAVETLAKECNLTAPNTDTEEYKERRRKLDNREKALEVFTSALWSGTPEAKEVLDYLHSRSWTDEEIRVAGLGAATSTLIASLPDLTEFKVKGIGTTHTLAIPYRNGSRLFGFKFREARKELRTPLKYLNTPGLPKGNGLFGIGIGIEDVVIVESELDALHAQARGFRSIAATTGGAVTEGQLQDAIKRGAKRITLLLDNDEAGRKFVLEQKNGQESGTLPLLEAHGVETYVASFPEDSKDVDEFFQNGHSVKELETLCDEALPSHLYRYDRLQAQYVAKQEEQEGKLTLKQREDFLQAVARILNAPNMKRYDRPLIFARIAAIADSLRLELDSYKELLDMEYNLQEQQRRTEETKRAAQKVDELLKAGKGDEALALMESTAEKARERGRATKFSEVFAPPSSQELEKFLSELKEGLPTGFKFGKKGQEEPLTLNEGLTFVCAKTGHGKTTFLNNIAINEARRQLHRQRQTEGQAEAKHVLYFSYEIGKRRLIPDLLNTFVNDPEISNRPLDTIHSHIRTYGKSEQERARYFTGGEAGEKYAHFLEKKRDFYENYLSSGVLTIVDEPYKVEELLEAIKFYLKGNDVSLVCIDYAQLIYSETYSRQRTEEIKRVVTEIKEYAVKVQLPFVLAAQFNRKIESPLDMVTDNIGEGGDFERIADTCIGLYNLKSLKAPKEDKAELEKLLASLIPELDVNNLESEAEKRKVENKILFRLMKRRYGYYPLDAVLDWEGRTKYIAQNDPDHFLTGYTQEELFKEEEERELPPF